MVFVGEFMFVEILFLISKLVIGHDWVNVMGAEMYITKYTSLISYRAFNVFSK